MAKAKLQITMEEELLEAVDDYCDKNYMNRSWLISQALVQLLNQQKVVDSLVSISFSINKIVETGTIDDETRKEMEELEALCKLLTRK